MKKKRNRQVQDSFLARIVPLRPIEKREAQTFRNEVDGFPL
jgi:hypothetical protein